jgi:hypothetical protein
MSSDGTARRARTPGEPAMKKLLEQYECGPIQFTGTGDALYERHLMFDNVVDGVMIESCGRSGGEGRRILVMSSHPFAEGRIRHGSG